MKHSLTDILSLSGVYIASTIGAAFASGQEVVRFFTRHGVDGGKGTVISGFLFALSGIAVLDLILNKGIKGESELLSFIAGRKLGALLKLIIILFSGCVFGSMISGAASLTHYMLGLPYGFGVLTALSVCLAIAMKKARAIASMGLWIAPVLISGMLYITLSFINGDVAAISLSKISFPAGIWLPDAILYVCYNSVLNFIVMAQMYEWIKKRAIAWIAGLMGGITLCVLLFIINQAMFMNWRYLYLHDLPMLGLAQMLGETESIIYTLILMAAILTTAASSGLCFVDGTKKLTGLKHGYSIILLGMVGFMLSEQGVMKLISALFPLFGYLGIPMFILVFTKWLRALNEQ